MTDQPFAPLPDGDETAAQLETAPPLEAVVESGVEEAVLASLLAAHDVTGVEGRTIAALPVDRVRRLLEGRTP